MIKLLALAGAIGGGGGLVAGAIQYAQPPMVGITSFPKVALLDLDGTPLTVKKALASYNQSTSDLLLFNYPLRNEPNFLLNVTPAAGSGLPIPPVANPLCTYAPGQAPPPSGPALPILDGNGANVPILAFSAICQHLGCPAPAIAYYSPVACPGKTFPSTGPSSKTPVDFFIHCSCHGSTYDVTNGAANLTGPAVLPLPQVALVVDPVAPGGGGAATGSTPSKSLADYESAQIYAYGMYNGDSNPPVNGHFSTLTGDYSVGNSSQLQKQSPVIICQFP